MTLTLTTKYENVDEEWLTWWLRHNGPSYRVRSLHQLEEGHEIISNDSTSAVVGTTRITLETEE